MPLDRALPPSCTRQLSSAFRYTTRVLGFVDYKVQRVQLERHPGKNNKHKAESSEPLVQRCRRQHLQFFVHHNLISTTAAACAHVTLANLRSQEFALCRWTVLEEGNELLPPPLPPLLPAHRTGVGWNPTSTSEGGSSEHRRVYDPSLLQVRHPQ